MSGIAVRMQGCSYTRVCGSGLRRQFPGVCERVRIGERSPGSHAQRFVTPSGYSEENGRGAAENRECSSQPDGERLPDR